MDTLIRGSAGGGGGEALTETDTNTTITTTTIGTRYLLKTARMNVKTLGIKVVNEILVTIAIECVRRWNERSRHECIVFS